MRLLLTSDGFSASSKNIREAFLKAIGKPAAEARVGFIPTAAISEEEKSFVDKSRRELTDAGITEENIINLELDHLISYEELIKFDVIYVCGGNTFYLLKKVQESKFNIAIRKYLDNDKGLYVGVSAGTVLAGPNIEIAGPWDDSSIVDLADTNGLNFVEEAYSPHYEDEEKEILDSYRKRTPYQIKELRDGEAILINDKHKELIKK